MKQERYIIEFLSRPQSGYFDHSSMVRFSTEHEISVGIGSSRVREALDRLVERGIVKHTAIPTGKYYNEEPMMYYIARRENPAQRHADSWHR